MTLPGFERLNHCDNVEPCGYDPVHHTDWTADMLPLDQITGRWIRLSSVFPYGTFFSERFVVAGRILKGKEANRPVLVYPPDERLRGAFRFLGDQVRVLGKVVVFSLAVSVDIEGYLTYKCNVRIYPAHLLK